MKLRCAVLMLAFFAANAHAQQVQGYVESENVITSTAATPQLNLFAYGSLKGNVGWQFWGIASRTWSEGYIGPTYTPKPWITFAVGAGAETGGARFGWSASGSKGKFFYLSTYEWGQGSGYWYKNLATISLNKRLSVGIWAERGKGVGPTVSFQLFKGFRPYATVFGSDHGTNAAVGATYSFCFGKPKK